MSSYRPSGSPLRDKSPVLQRDTINFKGSLRQPTKSPNNRNGEEEEYERRRQEEIRKQMSTKEYELKQPHLPLRASSNYNSVEPFSSSKNYQSMPERDKSPAGTHFTLGPQVQQEAPSLIDPPPHVKEHIANIQSDNQSLMRRLNLVIQELDRVNREKDDLYSRLKASVKDTNELNKMLNGEDNIDKVNRYMQDDLAYERDKNLKIKQQIKELDLYKSDLILQLRKIQESQDDFSKENQQLSYSLQSKLVAIQDLEKEHYFTQEKIRQIQRNIDGLKGDLVGENVDKSELQNIINELIRERNDLLNRLDHLAKNYDECVRDISHDRAEMEAHNKQHAKLITAKIIFQQLEQIQKNRKANGFSEFKQYCQFDNKCHAKLSQFAKVLGSIGHYKLRQGLRQWFKNACKPIGARQQSVLISEDIHSSHLRQKHFAAWRRVFQAKVNSYNMKTKALQKIWALQQKDTTIELKRAFSIWKETLQKFELKKQRVRKLIWRMYFNQISLAFNSWQNHSSNVDVQVRMQLLSKNFSQKQYMTLLFNNFRYQVTLKKDRRINVLFHCMKNWKDYLAYQKFIMGSNLSALHFRKRCNEQLLKACFDAFRYHKEQEKLAKVNRELHEIELPLIEQLTEHTDEIQVQRKFKAKQQACESVKKMMAKQLYGYFLQWKTINEDYKEKLRTTLKDRIIKAYMEQMRKSFTAWKSVHDGNKISQQQMVIQEFQQEQNDLQNEVLELQKEIQAKNQQKDCSQQKQVLKCVSSYNRRMIQIAIGRWRDQCQDMNIKEDGASTIIRRLRLRFLRKAFDLYFAGVKYKKKLMIEEERCALYHRTRNERLKKQVYHAWLIFKARHVRAKKYWNRMYLRLDLGQKQQAIKIWHEYAQRMAEKELESKQNQVIENIDDLNHEIGKLHENETQQQIEISGKKQQMTQQARRIISNAFARYYYISETRGIEKWKEFVTFEKRKERIMKKFVDHWRKYSFYQVKAALQNWILNSKIDEKKAELKKETMRAADTQQALDFQTQTFNALKGKLDSELEQIKKLQEIYNTRMQKSVQMIIKKVDNNHYISQKRYILQQWREYVKREVNFINCIQNVIQKSLWNKGFQEIREHARSVQKDNHMEKTLERFRLKFWKRTCCNAFSVWRSGGFATVTQTIEEVTEETNQVIEDHEQKKAVFKQVNQERSERIIKKHQLHNLWQAWKNVTQFLKLHNYKNGFYQAETELFQRRMALQRWRGRKEATKLARLRYEKLKKKFYQIRLRQYFNALRDQFLIVKSFCQRLSNLASIHDHQCLKLSLNAIISYSKAKQFVNEKRKEESSKSIEHILTKLLERRKQQYLNDLRIRVLNHTKIEKIKGFTILLNIGNQVRHYFQKWRESSNSLTLAKEMHEEGPIREEVFQDSIVLANIKNLMTKEGYDQKDIEEALKKEKGRQASLLLKGVRRMQHYNEEGYCKPKFFDRWREYVHMRKLFRYWLNHCAKRGEFIKSDLHWSFDTWKNHYPKQFEQLSKLPKSELNKRLLKNQDHLNNLAEIVDDKENQLENLNNQREELLENYVKGQKLAMSLMIHHRKNSLHQAFLRWQKTIKTIQNNQSLDNLRRNIELIENLKNKINQLESDNETLATENEELRQFSLDGYEIAKNVQTLTSEREKLSVDLADKAQVIRKLLDENEKLTQKLRYAQDEAQKLIRSTMSGSTGFKSGFKGPKSPSYT